MKLYIANKLEQDIEEYIENNNVHTITNIDYISKIIKNNIYNLSSFTQIIIDINDFLDTQEDIINTIIAIKKIYSSNLVIVIKDIDKQDIIIKSLLKSNITRFLIYSDNFVTDLEEMLNNKTNEVSKEKKCIKIGIVGSQIHIGVTTQCVNLASFLNSYNYKVCYIQNKKSKDISLICNSTNNNEFEKNGIYFITEEKIVLNSNIYDYCIYDYGVLNQNNKEEFISCDIKVLVTGNRIYEIKELEKSFKYLENIKDINLIVNYNNKDSNIKKSLYRVVNKGNIIHFSNYINDIFDFSSNKDIYFNIMKSYLLSNEEKKDSFNKSNCKKNKMVKSILPKVNNKNLKVYIKKVFKIIINIMYCILISLGITVLLNSSTRDVLINIIK